MLMINRRRILQEFQDIVNKPDLGWTAELYYLNDLQKWKIYLDGPSGTPYENGKYQLSVIFPDTYPFTPPEFRFQTRIFHPNISLNGQLSLDLLIQSKTYTLKVTTFSVMKEIISLLQNPDLMFPLCPEAAFLFSEDPHFFRDKATSWANTYAINDDIMSSGSISAESIQHAFSPAESDRESSRSSSPSRPKWLFRPRSLGTEVHDDKWQPYSKSDQRVLEHAYQHGQSIVELEQNLLSFSDGLQVTKNYEEYLVKRLLAKPTNHRRKYRSLAFARGEYVQPIPIIDQCLSSSVSACLSAVVKGIREEGLLQKKHTDVEKVIELLGQIPEDDTDVLGLRCIHLYTHDLFIHRTLNKFLRDQDFSKVPTLGPFFKVLYSQFGKYRLEPDKAESLMVYRGAKLNSAELRAFKRGTGKKSFHWLEFLSTSKDIEAAKIFVKNAFFVIRLNKLYGDGRAIDISKISQFDEEKEVLLRPGVEFSIKTCICDDEEKKIYTFHLDAYI